MMEMGGGVGFPGQPVKNKLEFQLKNSRLMGMFEVVAGGWDWLVATWVDYGGVETVGFPACVPFEGNPPSSSL